MTKMINIDNWDFYSAIFHGTEASPHAKKKRYSNNYIIKKLLDCYLKLENFTIFSF